MVVAYRIHVAGIVQGVGFRPFIYRLATRHGLAGYVLNLGGSEVEIWVEGEETSLEMFLRDLREERPPAAIIDRLDIEKREPKGFTGFEIRKSGKKRTIISMIPPDFGVCDHCMREVLDPTSRWYRYPFHSCAWCGPRFTVMHGSPYDRENTSMASFPLCAECRKEYSDPENIRRFHIQGISCPRCGPQLYLLDSRGAPVRTSDPLVTAASLIDEGYIVAVRGIGGFHLAALASDEAVVEELRRRKRRGRKPFAVMALDIDVVRRIAYLGKAAEELLLSPRRPIVVLPKKAGLAEGVAPGLNTVGVMIPYTPLHYLLLMETKDKYLVMTSGNLSGRPIARSIGDALRDLAGIADYYLVHNREIVNRADDSVVRFTEGEPILLRRSRGYAPTWIEVNGSVAGTIAYGALLNNTGAVGVDRYIVPTQHIGDLENLETLGFLEEALGFLERNYGVDPCEAVHVSDLHPSYLSTRYAAERAARCGSEHVRVQHHVAHIAAVMAEYGIDEAYGVAVDGVGYGTDGVIWGGEVLHVARDGYERLGHLEELPLPGGDRATRYPARIVIGLLAEHVGVEEAVRKAVGIGLDKRLPGGTLEARAAAVQSLRGPPRATSMGRFLDAVSALLGVCWERSYEGEPAIRLEEAGLGGSLLEERLLEREDGVVLTRSFLLSIIENAERYNVRDVAYTAQYLAARRLGEIAMENGAHKVLVAGGAAVNTIIVKALRSLFGGENVIIPHRLPPGDGSISVGQVYAASALGIVS